MINEILSKQFHISDKTIALANAAEGSLADVFSGIDKIAEYNQYKVQKAFADKRVSDTHFVHTTGYGYDDLGRDTLEKVYAQVFGGEDALVRHSIISGTHAIALCLFGALRPGDAMLSVTGKPYDTLEGIIGIKKSKNIGSLKDFGVSYRQVDLDKSGSVDFDEIKKQLTDDVKVVFIQRSKGYAWRKSLTIDDIAQIVDFVKNINKDVICIVDNCYGEFVEDREPTDVGADLIAGSLIKNPGGGLAETGGYIVGRADLVSLAAIRLNIVGKEVGASLGHNKPMFQGLFLAPNMVSQSLKTAVLAASMLESLGYETSPKSTDKRSDIIQAVKLLEEELVIGFCQGIQSGSPIDAFVSPEPWDMPGYSHKVIMAAGGFTQGSSIEISADAPIKPPYIAYLQGGLTFHSGKLAVMRAIDRLL